MRDYCRISPHFWTGDTGRKIRALGHEAQVVAFYLLSCPSSNMIGLFYLPLPTLCHETGSPFEGASKALRSLQKLGFAFYDSDSEVVWVPEMAKYQIGEELKPNDNQIKGVVKELRSYAGSVFYASFVDRYNEPYNLGLRKPLASPLQAPSKPLRSQEQEQEQEKEQEQGKEGMQGEAEPENEPPAGGASSGPSPSAPAASRAPSSKALGPATAKTRAEPAAKKRARPVTTEGAAQQLARFPDLDVPAVREAMSRWLAVAGSEGPVLSPAALEEQLRKCAEIGPVRAAAALLNSAHKRLRYVVEAFGGNGAGQNEPANGGTHPAPPANAIPPPGLRFKPEKIGGVWYITATDTGISHSRSSWPARWGPWRLTPENWKAEQWGPCPENLDDDPREELPPRRQGPHPQPPPGLTVHA